MSKKSRQAQTARKLIRDRERLAALEPGGSAARPMMVESAAVIEPRAANARCPQCQGHYVVGEHVAGGAGLRVVTVTCRTCHVSRQIWFQLTSFAPS